MQLAQIINAVPGIHEVDGVVTINGFEYIFRNIVTIILGLAGILLFIMFTVGGFRLLTAGSDPKAAEAGKKTLTYAVGGIVLIALAFLILRFIEEFTGAGVTDFTVTSP